MGSAYEEALALAAQIHRGQRRKGTDIAYISHVTSVSALVLEDGGTEVEAIAALLHDAIEDGPSAWVRAELAQRFDKEVLCIVEACSDDAPDGGAKQPWVERKEGYVAHLQDACDGALKVTAADKLHNLRCTLEDLRELARDDVLLEWPKSNACVHLNLWYYASVTDAVRARLPRSRSGHALDRTLEEVCQLLEQDRPQASASVPGCPCFPHEA
jgi:(p)ppGpp synthase/HD superfamily hydrolase